MLSQQIFSLLGGPRARAVFAALTVLALLKRRRPWSAAALVTAVGGAGALNTALKIVVRRQRPQKLEGIAQAGGYSWPSGHTTGSFVFFGVLPYLLWTPARRPLVTAATVMGSMLGTAFVGRSRIVLRQHHESDVLSGYAVGAAWLAVVLKMFEGPLRRERV